MITTSLLSDRYILLNSNRQHHTNLPDSQVGHHPPRTGFLGGLQDTLFGRDRCEGYAVDLNRNGRYDRGTDGVLAFDINKDGAIDTKEIEESNRRLKAFGGNYDANGDGKVSFFERISGAMTNSQMKKLDTNGDGRLSGSEFAAGGGRVVVDHNRDGSPQRWESYSPSNFPNGWGRSAIDYIDPRNNYTATRNVPW